MGNTLRKAPPGFPHLLNTLAHELRTVTDSKPLVWKQVEWKLKRGKWRPKLLDYAKSLKEDDVQRSSEEAFSIASKITEKANPNADLDGKPLKDALQSLTQLKVCRSVQGRKKISRTAMVSLLPYSSMLY